jgi:hypothetical protein
VAELIRATGGLGIRLLELTSNDNVLLNFRLLHRTAPGVPKAVGSGMIIFIYEQLRSWETTKELPIFAALKARCLTS